MGEDMIYFFLFFLSQIFDEILNLRKKKKEKKGGGEGARQKKKK